MNTVKLSVVPGQADSISDTPLPLRKYGPDRGPVTQVLLVDGDSRVCEGFRKVLSAKSLGVTTTTDLDEITGLISELPASVVLLDLDTPEAGAGMRLLLQLKEKHCRIPILLMTSREQFDVAVDAFRAGAVDVVAKTPENISYIVDRVVSLCGKSPAAMRAEEIVSDTLEIHEGFLHRLIEEFRRAERSAETNASTEVSRQLETCVVLLVDDDTRTLQGFQGALTPADGFHVVGVQTGGEALDFVGRRHFHLALIKDGIPDLPSSMVARSLRDESSDGIVVLYTNPSRGRAGKAHVVEVSQNIELISELTTGDQLVEQVKVLREGYLAKARERRYLQRFRQQHFDFLQRYAGIRKRLQTYLSE